MIKRCSSRMWSRRMSNDILLTGFGPFPGVDENPTQTICETLSGQLLGSNRVFGRVLDVSYERAGTQLSQAMDLSKPALLVMLGVASTSCDIRIETQAVNRRQADQPDVDGRGQQPGRVSELHEEGKVLWTSVDAESLAEDLCLAGFSARVSNDAGRYVCNATYFRALASSAGALPALFIHVPPPGSQSQAVDMGGPWTAGLLLAGVAHALKHLATNYSRVRV